MAGISRKVHMVSNIEWGPIDRFAPDLGIRTEPTNGGEPEVPKALCFTEESGQLILAVRGRIFTVESDNAVTEAEANHAACGSGEPYALGALDALQRAEVQLADEELATVALRTAAKLSPTVRPPWHFLRTTAAAAALKAA